MKKTTILKRIATILTVSVILTSIPLPVRATGDTDALTGTLDADDRDDAAAFSTKDGGDQGEQEALDPEKLSVEFTQYDTRYYDSEGEETIPGFTYSGKAVKPAVKAYYDGKELNKKEYSVSYRNNIHANKGFFITPGSYELEAQDEDELPAVIVTGRGKYAGLEREENFVIFRKRLNEDGSDLSITNLTTNLLVDMENDRAIPVPTVKYGKTALVNGTDFRIRIYDFTDQEDREETTGEFMDIIPKGYYGTGELVLTLTGDYSNGYDETEPEIPIGTINIAGTAERSLKDAKVTAGSKAKKAEVVRDGIGKSSYEPAFGVYDESDKCYYAVEDGEVTDLVVKANEVYTVHIVNADRSRTYLVYGRDFSITKRNTHAVSSKAKPCFDIIGMGDYVGTIRGVQVSPQRKKLDTKKVVWDSFVPTWEYDARYIHQEYDGLPGEISGISCDGTVFAAGYDFTETYKNNLNAGTASVTVTMLPRSGYTGKFTRKYKITKYDIGKAQLEIEIDSLLVNSKKPGIRVSGTFKDGRLITAADYSVSFKKNKKTMTMTVTVKGKKNFSGSVKADFPMTAPTALSEEMFTFSNEGTILIGRKELALSGVAKQLAVSYADGGVIRKDLALAAGTDYKVAYAADKKNSVMNVTVKGCGNFTGTFTKTYPMEYPAVTEDLFEVEESVDYDASGAKAGVAGTYKGIPLKEGKDYTLSYVNHKKAGTATVTIKGKGNFNGSIKKDYRVRAIPFGLCEVEVERVHWVNSVSKFEPAVTVTYKGRKLKKGTDYTVSYADNTLADSREKKDIIVTVTPKGNYEGDPVVKTTDYYYRVINNMTVCLVVKEGTNYYNDDGRQVKPEIEEVWHTNGITHYKITEGKDFVVKGYGANNTAGNYKGSITIEGVDYYGGSTTIKFDILQKKKYEYPTYSDIGEGKSVNMDRTLTYINEYRDDAGLEPLELDPKLQQIARQRVIQFVTERKTKEIHKYVVTDGECLAWATYKMTEKELAQGWYDSEGHRRDLLMKKAKTAACAAYCKGGEYYYCYVCDN